MSQNVESLQEWGNGWEQDDEFESPLFDKMVAEMNQNTIVKVNDN